MSIPFIDLRRQYLTQKTSIDAAIQRVLDHGQYIMGPEVAELEQRLAAYVGVRHCITCASGTEALLIALMSLGIGPGDEVITSPFTFVATAEVIALAGARPVFVDIEPDTYNLDASLLEAAITPQTRAIMPVSLYGQVADMDAINVIAARHGLPVIEDAAQSFGARYGAKRSCGLSTFGCTSFFPSKPLGCYGDGGAMFTDDDGLALAAREIRVHGQERRYFHTRVGVGGRMDTLQCAVVLAKLGNFEVEVTKRGEVGRHYGELFAQRGLNLALPTIRDGRTSVYAQYTIGVPGRDVLQAALHAAGIPTAIHYPVPLHLQPAYAGRASHGDLSRAEQAARRVISLPMDPFLSAEDQAAIVTVAASALAGLPRG